MKKYNIKLITQMYNTCCTHLTCDSCPYHNSKPKCPGRDLVKARFFLRHELKALQDSRNNLKEDRDLFKAQFNATEAEYLKLHCKFNVNKPKLWIIGSTENMNAYAAYSVTCRILWDSAEFTQPDTIKMIVIAPNNYDAEDYAREYIQSGKSGWNVKQILKITAMRDEEVLIKGEIY